ncbi:hypothetical protein [Sphingobium sp.]|uniref:hypothetical protein n=1 Tax=Sphingobium sp. TaxID=1912891 RepID=UPI00257C97ED|nr:hypothetical protein [Sphingobium sp.]
MTPETWRSVMALNLDSHVLSACAIGSDAVGMVTPPGFGFSHYITSKMDVIGLVRALAGDNIVVNAVHPVLPTPSARAGC